MKRYLLVFVFSVSFFCLYSQCTIDYNYIPNGANYGLDPDSLPFTDEKTFDLLSRGDLEETQSVLEIAKLFLHPEYFLSLIFSKD